ncbi:uncharacterized protein LOC105193716 [Solenopsis invicta]|uniref:uncharacterized protein LOC105193716 n=1 Tax=Solenopsis invicta TaxID=13686 RepID=UPI000595CB05|nr:uncharacterized protein LOC105193716 [Solenopsis invicta]
MNRLFLSVVLYLCLHSSFKIIAGQTCKPTCTEIGAFLIYDGTCKNYYACEDDGEKLNSIILSCASSAIFDQILGRCVPKNRPTTTDLPISTTLSSTISASSSFTSESPSSTSASLLTTSASPSTTSAPVCDKYGRFPISDVKCKKYYYCYWNGNRYDIMNNLTCPNTLVFNPGLEKCVPPQSYTCPKSDE